MAAIALYDLVGADDRRFSSHCWRIRPALAHKGLDFETVPTPFTGIPAIGDGSFPTLPVIRDGETWVCDSGVIAAYLGYNYIVTLFGFDLEAAFSSVAVLLPLIGILIGFIPGCGPQVLVTTLYINGLVPFAALLGNAISNDGDALFPAIALNPKAAMVATLVSGIPAVLMAYGFYFFAPNFF